MNTGLNVSNVLNILVVRASIPLGWSLIDDTVQPKAHIAAVQFTHICIVPSSKSHLALIKGAADTFSFRQDSQLLFTNHGTRIDGSLDCFHGRRRSHCERHD